MCLQAYQCFSIIMFYLSLTASINLPNAMGDIHIVGDSNGWTDSTNFSSWTDGKEFHVGDVLAFNYESMLHNVLQVDSTAYEDCIKDSYIQQFSSGNDSVALVEVGEIWFICGVGDHCENGQKLGIIVRP